jgi:hypothetical protein
MMDVNENVVGFPTSVAGSAVISPCFIFKGIICFCSLLHIEKSDSHSLVMTRAVKPNAEVITLVKHFA